MNHFLTDKLITHMGKLSDKPRNYIGASQIGSPCDRRIWYEYNAYTPHFTSRQKIIFETGRRLEKMLLDLMSDGGVVFHGIKRPDSKKIIECGIDGTPDAIYENENKELCILDIKSCNTESFHRFVNHGLRVFNEQYYYQLQAYMGLYDLQLATLLAINKNNCEIHEESFEFDENLFEYLCLKAKNIAADKEPPERIGVNQLYYFCQMCPFVKTCFEMDG